MKKLGLMAICAAASLMEAAPAQAAVTIITNSSGIMTGAQGVSVAGKLYDVTFHNRCAEAYGSCSLSWKLPFTTEATATTAMRAMAEQVFSIAPTTQTLGCEGLQNGCFSSLAFQKWDNPQATRFFFDVVTIVNPSPSRAGQVLTWRN